MKILLVALGLEPPWTEGRKNLLRDLIPILNKHVELRLLSIGTSDFRCADYFSISGSYFQSSLKSMQFVKMLVNLKKELNSWKPDILIHFPYGTFCGMRGILNYAMVLFVHRIAAVWQTPCLTTLYSMTSGNMQRLQRHASPCATVGVDDWDGYIINTGIKMVKQKPCYPVNTKNLLFMAGYQDDNPALLNSILYDRGLIDILKIGDALARAGFSLSIAIPLLRHPKRENELKQLIDRYCGDLAVTLYTEKNIYQLVATHSLYLFPYRKHHNVFIPTSVIEAMSAGMPVVISDLSMFRPLIGGQKKIVHAYEPGNHEALLRTILQATKDWGNTVECSRLAFCYVHENWSVEKTAEQMISIAQDIIPS